MEGYGPATYGDRIAETYDALYEGTLDTEGAVETLADLAAGGPVLELAIGTGRLALPLVEKGLEVHGIDASERMVEKLRAKPGGERDPGDDGRLRRRRGRGRVPADLHRIQHALRAADAGRPACAASPTPPSI